MNLFLSLILLTGLSSLGMGFMPTFTQKTGISYSLIYVAAGALIYWLIPQSLPSPLPQKNPQISLHFSELIVIVSLMGTGIKIDQPFSFKSWSVPLKLVSISMVVCIAISFVLGHFLLGLAFPSALLLAAALAPTDPVLASDVQVGPPQEQKESNTKFSLTAEAGLNDGLAFPFTSLAIFLCAYASEGNTSFYNWIGVHVIYKIGAGIGIGYIAGRCMGYILFRFSRKFPVFKSRDGLLALSITLCVYGITELVHGYGFIAVFVSALTLRHFEKSHHYHTDLHEFSDQIERLLLGILLIFFGGALVSGILSSLTLPMALFSILLLLVVRPGAVLLTLVATKIRMKEKLAISFFGIRGMGSIFYIAFGIANASFRDVEQLWAITAFTILLSIVIHGLTASKVMKYLGNSASVEKI